MSNNTIISGVLFMAVVLISYYVLQPEKVERDKIVQSSAHVSYKHLKAQFYVNTLGELVEKKYRSIRVNKDDFRSEAYYDNLIYVAQGDTFIQKKLTEIIDIPSYTDLDSGTYFSRDKNNVYFSFSNSGGCTRSIVIGADAKSFKPLSDYRYGMDKENVFYQSKKIEGLNYSKHQFLYSLDTTDFFISYVKDNNVVFYDGDTLKGADAMSFKLVSGQRWEAEDKYHTYGCCGQRME